MARPRVTSPMVIFRCATQGSLTFSCALRSHSGPFAVAANHSPITSPVVRRSPPLATIYLPHRHDSLPRCLFDNTAAVGADFLPPFSFLPRNYPPREHTYSFFRLFCFEALHFGQNPLFQIGDGSNLCYRWRAKMFAVFVYRPYQCLKQSYGAPRMRICSLPTFCNYCTLFFAIVTCFVWQLFSMPYALIVTPTYLRCIQL